MASFETQGTFLNIYKPKRVEETDLLCTGRKEWGNILYRLTISDWAAQSKLYLHSTDTTSDSLPNILHPPYSIS